MPNIGKVVVRPINRTTISSPNFNPKVNVSIGDISDFDISIREEGDVLIYNSTTQKYVSGPIDGARISLTEINGGTF
jgi:hypothetical protein